MLNSNIYSYKGAGNWVPAQLPEQPYVGVGSPITYHSNIGAAANWAKLGLGGYVFWRLGQIQLDNGGKVWDKYTKAARFLEERSPAKILRTFSLSTLMSPGETLAQAERFIPPEQWAKWFGIGTKAQPLGAYYGRLMGLTTAQRARLAEVGATFREGALHLGQGEEILLRHARIMRAPMGNARILEEIARASTGLVPEQEFGRGLFSTVVRAKGKYKRIRDLPISQIAGESFTRREPFLVVGGEDAAEYAAQVSKGVATDLIQRFNRLLWTTQETVEKHVPGLKGLMDKLPATMRETLALGVERQFVNGHWVDLHTTASRTLGKMFLKYGIGLPLAIGAWQTVDWATREAGTEGLNAWIAKGYMYGKMALSSVAEVTGLHRLREWQEQAAPGSTSLVKLGAFPATFAFYGAISGYVHKQKVYHSIKRAAEETLGRLTGERAEKFAATMDYRIEMAARSALKKSRWQGKIFRWLEDRIASSEVLEKTNLLKRLKSHFLELSPLSKRAAIGAGIGLALIAPFIPGALVPSERPDEIRRKLQAEEDVPIMKGRWWPMGRSSYEGSRVVQWRPHWSALIRARPIETQLWGGPTSPFMKWFLKNFTYTLENTHYYDRPYGMCLHPETPILTADGYKKIKEVQVGDLVLNKDGKWTPVTNVTRRKCFEGRLLEIKIAGDNRKIAATPDHRFLVIRNNSKTSKYRGRCRRKDKVVKEGKLEWVKAEDLRVSDLVVIAIPQGQKHSENISFDLSEICNFPATDELVVWDPRVTQSMVSACYCNLSAKESCKEYKVSYKQIHGLKRRGGYKRTYKRKIPLTKDLALFLGLYLAEGWTSKQKIEFPLT